jgi:hypothetical protein
MQASPDMLKKMVKEHTDLVALYPVKVGAPKAQVSKKINDLESDMLSAGLAMSVTAEDDTVMVVTEDGLAEDGRKPDFIHFVIPTAYTRKWDTTPDELLARIESRRKQALNELLPDIVRSKAESQILKDIESASKRGITVPDGYTPVAS